MLASLLMASSENEPEEKGTAPLGEDHWSKARAGENQEALDYYRERSKAPGVEAGGGLRNHYCFECDGVIELEHRYLERLQVALKRDYGFDATVDHFAIFGLCRGCQAAAG